MRVIGILALLFGALHVALGLVGLSEYELIKTSLGSLIQSAQENQIKGFEGVTAEAAAQRVRFIITFSVAIGFASLISGVGLLTRRLWAARVWLAIISIATGVYAYRTISSVMSGDSSISLIVLSPLVLILFCISWFKLYKVRH
jgi:uncharacterized membrane protein (DUF2068 family)